MREMGYGKLMADTWTSMGYHPSPAGRHHQPE